ncbi:toll/interleukin-1 receptor domain-containing protein [Georgenia subflava]|uniref:TIR domain-containing protein n=1 Tax=Georgenia subflava TaxID=1622177 RepID=A0A6N7EDY1_9MICO|nr:toll/interleukin-1 receptor domain-containing protein [Georgenia subflava]MPV36319.1 TIR domain-containing protein [Georgenia subflava]
MRRESQPSPLAIFISYRRSGAAGTAGRLYDTLANRFGDDHVFMDVDSIEPGEDFTEVLARTLRRSRAMVVVIGPTWLDVRDSEGNRRLDDPDDFVRMEVEHALSAGLKVLPVLVEGATMPTADQLPGPMRKLAARQAIEISPTRYSYDAGRLVAALAPKPSGHPSRRMLAAAGTVVLVGGAGVAWAVQGRDREPDPDGTGTATTADPTDEVTPELLRLRVNFQNAAAQTPEGYLADFGEPFGPRTGPDQGEGQVYGWVHEGTHDPLDLVAMGRDRDTPGQEDQRLDTLMHMEGADPQTGELARGAWEIEVPDGRYVVTVVVGDAAPTSIHTINVEGVPVIRGFDGLSENYEESSAQVEVTDGVLTVDSVGGTNTKINYLHVVEVPS